METEQPAPPVLYHYTDAPGLKGIVEKRELWATHHRFLNDAAEVAHGIRILKAPIHTRPLSSTDWGWQEVMPRVVAAITDEPAFPIWVASFSDLPDDLGQWRAYSTQGGYCVGFDTARLMELFRARGSASPGFGLHQCTYGAKPFGENVWARTSLREAIESVLRSPYFVSRASNRRRRPLGMPLESEDHPNPLDTLDQVLDEFAEPIYGEAATLKNESFRAEQEWRAVMVDRKQILEPMFRPRGATLVPYVPISLGDVELPIVSIRTSPGANEATRAGLAMFVRRYADRLHGVGWPESGSSYKLF